MELGQVIKSRVRSSMRSLENRVVEVKQLPIAPQTAPKKTEHLTLPAPQKIMKESSFSLEATPVVIKAQPQAKMHKILATTKSNTAADHLYKERLLAGLAWEKIKKEDMYTVQLMALASLDAEINLKKLLAQVDYRQEAGNFYIFKKVTASGQYLCFLWRISKH